MMRRVLTVVLVLCLLALPAACSGGEVGGSPTTAVSTTTTTATTTTTMGGTEPWAESNLVYLTRISDGVSMTLDIHFPADPEHAPIVIEPAPTAVSALVEAGMITVTFDSDDDTDLPEDSLPELDFPVDDAHLAAYEYRGHGFPIRMSAERYECAIQLVRARASELGNDNPIVIVSGVSAGAGIAAHFALLGDTFQERWDAFAATGGPARIWDCAVTGESTHVDALVGTVGAYDLYVPIYDYAPTPVYGKTYLQEQDPGLQAFLAGVLGANPDLKIRLIHGIHDDGIPFDNSVQFAAALTDAGYDVPDVIPFDGGHEPPPDQLYLTTVKELLDE